MFLKRSKVLIPTTKTVVIKIKGTGPGKTSAVKQIENSKVQVVEVQNVTPKPHNGVKKKKKYRRR